MTRLQLFTPSGDPAEELWRKYYASIFNPARLKVGAMLKEMPRKYWKNMPETALIISATAPVPVDNGKRVVLHGLLEESAKSYREMFVGRTLSVLWESTSEMGEWGWQMEGLTENYLRVSACAPSPR